MNYFIDLQKANARGGKYKRRIPKAGGGYTYVYEDEKNSDNVAKIKSGISNVIKEREKLIDEITGKQILDKMYSDIMNTSSAKFRFGNMETRLKEGDPYSGKKEYNRDREIKQAKSVMSGLLGGGIKNRDNVLQALATRWVDEYEKKNNIKKSLGDIDLQKAVWSGKHKNDLPDSAFLYIEPGGKKDEEGKTVPRSLRHFPYKNIQGKIDVAHVRNAIARIPQSKCGLSASQIESLQNRARKYLNNMENAMNYFIDLQKANARGGKYKRRIPKAGGGYTYIYDEPVGNKPSSKPEKEWPTEDHPDVDQQAHTELELHADNTHSLYKQKEILHKNVVTKMAQGRYDPKQANKLWMYYADRVADSYAKEHGSSNQTGKTMFDKKTRQALAHSMARDFEKEVKNNPEEYKHLVPKKYQKDWGKSLGDIDMEKACDVLNDFCKSTIEGDVSSMTSDGKENGEGQSLAGKGITSGNSSGPAQPIGAPSIKTTKLSEDDEVDEENMKTHKKPIENARKSFGNNQQHEMMAYDVALLKSQCTRDRDISIEFAPEVLKKSEQQDFSIDEAASRLVKGEDFYCSDNPCMIPNSPLTSKQECIKCGSTFMKALTSCPNCGQDQLEKGVVGGKYKQRIAKPGGGYRYIYEDEKKPNKTRADLDKLKEENQKYVDKMGREVSDRITNDNEYRVLRGKTTDAYRAWNDPGNKKWGTKEANNYIQAAYTQEVKFNELAKKYIK